MYTKIIKSYIQKTNKNNFKYLSIDSQFVINKKMLLSYVGRNKDYKSKNGLRISAIVDTKGIPIYNSINSGNRYDSIFIINMMEKLFSLGLDPNDFYNKKKSKIYVLGDAGYHSKDNINFIKNNNMIQIIDYNKRNTKNEDIINENMLTKKQKEIFKKRHIVENSHAWKEEIFPRLGKIYDRELKNYENIHLLSIIHLILKRDYIDV